MKTHFRHASRLIVAAFLLNFVSADSPAAESRTWTDATGKFKVEAEFVEADNTVVVLKRKDGTRLEIPLARLSDADQKVVKSLMTSGGDDPFKAVDTPKTKPLPAGEVHSPNWSEAVQVSLAAGERWEIPAGKVPELGFIPKATGLPNKIDFFEKFSGYAVSYSGKRAVVSYELAAGRKHPKNTSRFVLVDLVTGRALANASIDGTFAAIALHDDGEQIVAEKNDPSKVTNKLTLVTLVAKGTKVTVQDEWIPYNQLEEGSRHVRFATFANQGKFIVCNEPGVVAVFDFPSRKLDFHFRISRTSIPALSPDRRYLGYGGGNNVGFINLETQEPVGLKTAPGMDFWVVADFSPSGKRFATSSHQKLMIWDLESGEVLFQGGIPGISLAYGLKFPDENFVLVSKEYLVDFASGIKVWQYTGSGAGVCRSGTMFMAAGAIIPMKMPHDEATQVLEKAKSQSDIFVVKKGSTLSIDVAGVPEQYQAEVKDSLAKQIDQIGCKVAPNAEVTVKATVTGPTQRSVSYHGAGSFTMNVYMATIDFVYQGKSIWSSSMSNTPGILRSPRDKSYQQQIDDAGAKPNLYFFGHANFPSFLQKPSNDPNKSPTAGAQQTLGVSKIGG